MMTLKKVSTKAKSFPINPSIYFNDRIGFWGTVIETNAKMNTCTVLSDTGIDYRGLPVACNTWVNTDEENNFITGTRHLPTINSRVFVLTPTKTAAGAFVLCSGFANGETNTGDFYANNDKENEEKQNESLEVTPSGWIKKENYTTGNLNITSQDQKIQITINQVENKENDTEKKVEIKAWNTSITIKEDGITFNTDQAVKLTSQSNINISSDKKLIVEGKTGIDINAQGQNILLDCKKFAINENGSLADFSVTKGV